MTEVTLASYPIRRGKVTAAAALARQRDSDAPPKCRPPLTRLDASTSGKDEIVVFYMPHCEGHLYESVVRARWSAEALADFICVGNTFETVEDRWRAKSADPERSGRRTSSRRRAS